MDMSDGEGVGAGGETSNPPSPTKSVQSLENAAPDATHDGHLRAYQKKVCLQPSRRRPARGPSSASAFEIAPAGAALPVS